jgi:hypothetical protein
MKNHGGAQYPKSRQLSWMAFVLDIMKLLKSLVLVVVSWFLSDLRAVVGIYVLRKSTELSCIFPRISLCSLYARVGRICDGHFVKN